MNYTKGPWKQHTDGDKTYASVRSPAGQIIADCGSRSDPIAQANAARIVVACNCHDDLLDVCQLLNKAFRQWSASDDEKTFGEHLEDVGLDELTVRAALEKAENPVVA